MSNGLWIGDAYAHGPGECAPEYAGLWEGLVGCWVPQMGSTGNRLLDLSGCNNHGTLTNMDPATDWVTGQDGWALDFDYGSNNYINCGNFANTTACTVSTIIKADSTSTDMQLAGQFSTAVSGEWLLQFDAKDPVLSKVKNINFTVIYGSYGSWPWFGTASNILTTGQWYHITATWQSGVGGAIYINGIDRTDASDNPTAAATSSTTTNYYIGNNISLSKDFVGQMAMQMYWQRCLTPGEVAANCMDPLGLLRPRRRWWSLAPSGSAIASISQYYRRLRGA